MGGKPVQFYGTGPVLSTKPGWSASGRCTLTNVIQLRHGYIACSVGNVPGLHCALYADDITLCTTTGSVAEQEATLQTGLNTAAIFLREVGLTASPDKTEYVVILDGPQRKTDQLREMFNLTLDGKVIRRKASIRILGHFIDQDGSAKRWMSTVTRTCRQVLRMLRCFAGHDWGLREDDLRQLFHARLSSRVMYSYPYYNPTTTKRYRLKTLHREAIQFVTGLPRCTRLAKLYHLGAFNTFDERAEAHIEAQRARLTTSTARRGLLQSLNDDIEGLPPLPSVSPP